MQLYSYTMQLANRLPFSQHLVPRYREFPAVPQISQFGGTGKIFFSSPQTLHQVSATVFKQDNSGESCLCGNRGPTTWRCMSLRFPLTCAYTATWTAASGAGPLPW